MTQSLAQQLNLPPMDQVGFVYRNLEAAIAHYEPLFGPFEIHEYGSFDYQFRGKTEPAELRLALGRSGSIEIELIEMVAGSSPHQEFLDRGQEGMHHLRFPVQDLDDLVARASPLGWHSIWSKQYAPGLAVAYLEHRDDPLLVELFENRHGSG